MNALLLRVDRCTPPVNRRSVETLLMPLARQLARGVGVHPPISYFDVYKNYGAKKRRRYARAEEILKRQGGIVTRRQGNVNMFIKIEGLKFTDEKRNPDCRAIQFRSFEYTLALARAIKRAEHRLYKAKDIPGFPSTRFIAKGMNPAARAHLLRTKSDSIHGCKYLELDATRWDAHVNVLLLKLEHYVWEYCCTDPEIANLLSMQIKNIGKFRVQDFVQHYIIKGGRMSGDSNTAAGNCIIMSCLLAAFGQHLGVKFDFVCDGDDSVFFYKRTDVVTDHEVESFFTQFGVDMKIEARPRTFNEINFCQAKPVNLGTGLTMIRDPFKVLSKIGVSHKIWDPKARAKYIRTIALGELSLSRGCPVVQPFLLAVIKNCEDQMTTSQKKRGMIHKGALDDNYRLREFVPDDWKEVKVLPITPESRETFSRAWGISVDEQYRLEGIAPTWKSSLAKSVRELGIDVANWTFCSLRPERW